MRALEECAQRSAIAGRQADWRSRPAPLQSPPQGRTGSAAQDERGHPPLLAFVRPPSALKRKPCPCSSSFRPSMPPLWPARRCTATAGNAIVDSSKYKRCRKVT